MQNEGQTSEIMVSVICIVYNHEKYIKECLDGFVMQKTSFPFEVIVHDDASTDRSAEIVREYERKHPKLIKPIYQTENQYSKGISVFALLVPQARGKYVAFCEGDDYWTDPNKLERQVEYLENHPECTLCFTNGRYLRGESLYERVVPIPNRKEFFKPEGNYNVGEMARLDFVPTASLMVPTRVVKKRPVIRKESFAGDAFLRLFCTYYGYAHYIDADTCVYRQGVSQSATAVWGSSSERIIRVNNALISLMEDMNKLSNGKYSDDFSYCILTYKFSNAIASNNVKELRQKKYSRYIRSLGRKACIKYFIRINFPKLFILMESLLRRMRAGS